MGCVASAGISTTGSASVRVGRTFLSDKKSGNSYWPVLRNKREARTGMSEPHSHRKPL